MRIALLSASVTLDMVVSNKGVSRGYNIMSRGGNITNNEPLIEGVDANNEEQYSTCAIDVTKSDSDTKLDAAGNSLMIADFENWEALAAYKADTMRDNIIEYVKTIAEVRAKVEYER